MTEDSIIYSYWGKAGKDEDCHLLVYHCLDVAACAVVVLRLLPRWRCLLQGLTGLSGDDLEVFVRVYAALHDLGKFATGFQNLRPDLLQRLQHRRSDKGYVERHDTLGYLLWRDRLRGRFLADARRRRRGSPNPGLDAWMRAVTGHHGEPPGESEIVLRHAFDPADFEAAEAFVAAVLELAGLDSLPLPPADKARQASWWIAGSAVLADWLGSNTSFFPYQATTLPLADYWRTALTQAGEAVRATGLTASPPASRFGLPDCFAESPADLRLTPLQAWAQRIDIHPGPSLFILEDVTGAGKTEAALLLAWRLLHANDGGGIYFGLPTMATANGMYQRLGGGDPPVYARLFDAGHLPSLTLAHGRAGLMAAFRASILPPDPDEADYGDGTLPAGPRCNAWLGDSRKKALLAEVGVGTIDQALLGVLPSRHQSLRLLGLLGKVLIVDEVHACDAYMNRLLERLLHAHARAGGSAILLSATLPYDQKRRLVRAFAEGKGCQDIGLSPHDAYPLATRLAGDAIDQQALETRPEVARRVAVEFVADEQAIHDLLEQTVAQRGCACWICNTVDDARRRFEALTAAHPDWSIGLFHARFSLQDRLRIEQEVLRHFGKDSGADDRRGRILIATQVVEQSLDLDFDRLISDLAPIDLVIQRAGRLCRHARDRTGRRIAGPDRRGIPILTLFAPPWSDRPGPRWLRDALPGTAAVYEEEDGRLWLAMKLLRARGGFEMPTDARGLVEGVYAADPFADIPEGLQSQALASEGQAQGQRSYAELKALGIEDGYRREGAWLDEDRAPTRLGEPTTTLWLARWQDGRLLPLHDDDPTDPQAWHLSSLWVRASLAAGEAVPAGVTSEDWEAQKEHLPGKDRWGVVMTLTPGEEDWHGETLDEGHRRRSWRYSIHTGLYRDPHHRTPQA